MSASDGVRDVQPSRQSEGAQFIGEEWGDATDVLLYPDKQAARHDPTPDPQAQLVPTIRWAFQEVQEFEARYDRSGSVNEQ